MTQLTRGQITDSVHDLGWRLISRNIQCVVRVTSLAEAVRVAAAVTEAAGDASAVSIDLRPHLVHVRLAAHAYRPRGTAASRTDQSSRRVHAVELDQLLYALQDRASRVGRS